MPESYLLKESERCAKRIRFDAFEIDFEERELRKAGVRQRLQRQPFRILELLLDRAGSLVTREELARHLWPGLHVCFDRGLNTAVNALRQILGDNFREPRYIETRPGLGYRFIGHIEQVVAPSLRSANGSKATDLEHETSDRTEALRKYAANFDAYQDYLKGRYFLSKMHPEGVLKAIAHFEAAIAQDANCAPAYAGLSDCYCDLAAFEANVADNHAARAKGLATAALELDSELAEAQIALARVRILFDFDWNAAQAACQRAIELAPDHAEAHRILATISALVGNHETALRTGRRARVLDPLSLPINTEIAWHLYVSRDYEGAVEQCWKVLTMEPAFSPAQYTLGLAYEQLDMHQEALTELRNAGPSFGHREAAISALGHAYARAGLREDALESLRQLEGLSTRKRASLYWRSLVYTGLGEYLSALTLIHEAHCSHDVALLWLNVDPRLDPLRADAGFQGILRNLNFSAPTYSAAFA